ncbi:MAG: histidine kinase [Holophagaceae bacterium]
MARPLPEFVRDLPRALLLGGGLGVVIRLVGLANHLGTSIALCCIFSVVMWCGFPAMRGWYVPDPGSTMPAERAATVFMVKISLLYVGLLALSLGLVRLLLGLNLLAHPAVGAITFVTGLAVTLFITTRKTIATLVEKERALALEAARAGFLGLQAQLQPHTLFNSLNTIAALIPEAPARAEEATLRLSALLRRILAALERPAWTLREEFDLLGDLLALESLRFEGRLAVDLRLDPAMAERPVPPLLLLPLVENSLKHGFRPKVGACVLRVEAAEGRVRVADDGVGRDPEAGEGVGLRTVTARLAAMGGALRWLDVHPGCAVEVVLP